MSWAVVFEDEADCHAFIEQSLSASDKGAALFACEANGGGRVLHIAATTDTTGAQLDRVVEQYVAKYPTRKPPQRTN